MVLRIATYAALALLSSACTYRSQAPVRDGAVDYSDYAHYDQPFGQSPSRVAPPSGSFAEAEQPAALKPVNLLGFSAAGGASADTVTTDVSDVEYVEVEATPGTACYEAAERAGIESGTCTLVTERSFLLVGEKRR